MLTLCSFHFTTVQSALLLSPMRRCAGRRLSLNTSEVRARSFKAVQQSSFSSFGNTHASFLRKVRGSVFSIARASLFLSATIALINSADAQDPANTTAIGVPKFATVTNGPDVINIGNLNVDYEFPIIKKAGRKLPFEASFTFDNSFWNNFGSNWSPSKTWGWSLKTVIPNGFIKTTKSQVSCGGSGFIIKYIQSWTNWIYIDSSSISHKFTGTAQQNQCTGQSSSFTAAASDGSGYTLTGSAGGAGRVTTVSGTTLSVESTGVNQMTDSNGNILAYPPANLWQDTLGMTVLTVTTGNVGISRKQVIGQPPYTPDTYAYVDSNGQQQEVTLNYSSYAVQTNFGCPGISEYNVSPVPLISSIVYSDGRTYSVTYEPTPGNPSAVTGRLGSVTLPTGGVIGYSYPGPNDGINCTVQDSSTLSLTRETPDGTTTYTRTNVSGTEWKTVVTYPADSITGQHNQTDFYFQRVTSPVVFGSTPTNEFYETKRQIFQGSDQGTPLETVHTCDNGRVPDCTTATISLPITHTIELTQLASGLQRQKVTSWNTAGLVTETDDYDWGLNAPGVLLKKTVTQYISSSSDRPSIITVYDGANNQVEQQVFAYDETAPPPLANIPNHTQGAAATGLNPTTVKRWLNTNNSFVITRNTYDDTGNLISQTDPLGNTTSFSYADNFSDGVNRNSLAYLTRTILPDTNSPNLARHVTSTKYDANTGHKVAAIDQNGNETDYSYDLMLRPVSVTLPADVSGNRPKTTLSYPDANTVTEQQTITSSLTDTSTAKLDGLGRVVQLFHTTPNGTATTDASYDSMGRLFKVTNPYFSTSDPTYGVMQTQFDTLGRPIQVTKQDGSVTTTQYDQAAALTTNSNCALSTDEAGKQRRSCLDGLARLIEVDEPGGQSPATVASGSFTINGTLQSWSATQTATSGHIEMTFSGALQSKANCSSSGQPCSDSGSITITVNTPSGAFTKSAAYSSVTGSDSGQTVQALANAFHSDSTSPVDAIYYGADESGNIVMDLVARATGSATNYPIAISIVSNDPTDFSPPSFQVSAGSSLIDGQDAATASTGGHAYVTFSGSLQSNASCSATSGQPCTDSGSISTTVTTASGAFTKSVAYSSATGSDSGQAVQLLANAFHSDNASPVDAFFTTDESGNYVLYLTARTTGSGTNYPLSTSIVSNDPADFPSPSFQVNEGSSLVGGQNGTAGSTVYDSGTVYVNVGPFVASAPYSQSGNNTAALVAAALVSGPTGLNQSSFPVKAVVSGSTITLTYKFPGSAGNVAVDVTSSSANPDNPSFSSPGNILSGGSDPQNGTIATPYVTLYHYDALNNVRCVHQKGADGSADRSCSDATVPSAWRPRNFSYDSLSRLLSATNPESGTITYSYDANGNLLQKTSPAPNQTGAATQTISYCYDALNRVTGKAYSAQTCPLSSPVVTYSYDGGTNGIGNLSSLADQAGSGAYTFDALGRMITEQRTMAGKTKTLAYTYNLDNSVAKLTYPSGAVVTYTPDSAGRMVSAVDSSNNINYVTSASYGPDNSLTGFVSGHSSSFAGITNTFSYNNRLQLATMAASSPTATLFSIGYDYHFGDGDNGNVYGIVNNRDTTRNQVFAYDALNRLNSAQNAGTDCSQSTLNGTTKYWGNDYAYDAWGNLLQKTVTKCSAENLSVAALASNQLVGYGYDAAGNIIHDATTGNNYSFDQENRITGAAGFAYTYDADGSRVIKSNGSTGTIYWDMTPGIVAESDLNGNLQHEYVFFAAKRIARRDLPSGSVSYYFSDRINSAAVIADSTGAIKEESDYYPWGGELQFSNNDSNDYKFSGTKRDVETGLDYFGARYYGNWIGRFITPDWAAKAAAVPYAELTDPQSLNLYGYVRNRPTVSLDPDGHFLLGANEVNMEGLYFSSMGAYGQEDAFTSGQPVIVFETDTIRDAERRGAPIDVEAGADNEFKKRVVTKQLNKDGSTTYRDITITVKYRWNGAAEYATKLDATATFSAPGEDGTTHVLNSSATATMISYSDALHAIGGEKLQAFAVAISKPDPVGEFLLQVGSHPKELVGRIGDALGVKEGGPIGAIMSIAHGVHDIHDALKNGPKKEDSFF